jgi:hypothetical protein
MQEKIKTKMKSRPIYEFEMIAKNTLKVINSKLKIHLFQ